MTIDVDLEFYWAENWPEGGVVVIQTRKQLSPAVGIELDCSANHGRIRTRGRQSARRNSDDRVEHKLVSIDALTLSAVWAVHFRRVHAMRLRLHKMEQGPKFS